MQLLSKFSGYPHLTQWIDGHWNVTFEQGIHSSGFVLRAPSGRAEIIPAADAYDVEPTLIQIQGGAERVMLYLCGMINSVVSGYLMRAEQVPLPDLPIPRLDAGNRYFDGIMARSALLVCRDERFAPLWKATIGSEWQEAMDAFEGDLDLEDERNQLDALVAHLYELSADDYATVLDPSPSRKGAAMEVFEEFTPILAAWRRV